MQKESQCGRKVAYIAHKELVNVLAIWLVAGHAVLLAAEAHADVLGPRLPLVRLDILQHLAVFNPEGRALHKKPAKHFWVHHARIDGRNAAEGSASKGHLLACSGAVGKYAHNTPQASSHERRVGSGTAELRTQHA
eukprot:2936726-Pyramimonas_sp.AAC.1